MVLTILPSRTLRPYSISFSSYITLLVVRMRSFGDTFLLLLGIGGIFAPGLGLAIF